MAGLITYFIVASALYVAFILNHESDKEEPVCPVSEHESALNLYLPSAPINLTIVGFGFRSVFLSWDEPKYDGGLKILGYKISYSRLKPEIWLDGEDVPATIMSVPQKVTASGLWQFRVAAYNVFGFGKHAEPVYIKKPSPPKNLTISEMNDGAGFIELTFSPPRLKRKVPITGYFLEYRVRNKETEWTPGKQVPGDQQQVHQPEMVVGEISYEFQLRAMNIAGLSKPSNIAFGEMPLPPRNLTIIRLGETEADLWWQEPEEVSGLPVIKYQVHYRYHQIDDNTVPHVWDDGVVVEGPLQSALQTNLIENEKYDFCVTAINLAGRSECSEWAHIQKASPPLKFQIHDQNLGAEHVEFSWHIPNFNGFSEITEYVIQYRNKEIGGEWKEGARIPASEQVGKVTTLKGGVVNEYRVVAVNAAGNGEPSETISISKPKPPRNLQIKDMKPDEGKVMLTWLKSEDDGGIPLVRYYIEAREKGIDPWILIADHPPTGKLELTLNNLNLKEKVHEFRAKAQNKAGSSESSNIAILEKPDPPINLEVMSISDGNVRLEWNKPDYEGGDKIEDNYFVEYKEFESDDEWQRLSPKETRPEVDEKLVSAYVKGLDEMKTYIFRVFARNKAGFSNSSNTDYVGK